MMNSTKTASFIAGSVKQASKIEVHATGINEVSILLTVKDVNGEERTITSRLTRKDAYAVGWWLMYPRPIHEN